MIKRPKNREVLKQVFNEFFGSDVDLIIRAKVIEDDNPREKKKQENSLKQKALGHPLIGEALEIFNGKIVEVNVTEEAGE